MAKTIMASLTGLSSDRTLLEAAVAAARIDGGHIQCLHTRIDAVKTAAQASFILPHHPSNLHGLLQKIATEEDGRSRHAKQVFDEVRKRHAIVLGDTPTESALISIAWKEEVSFLNETLHEARYHDLIVMARDEELASERILSVLMQSGRPLLLAPEKPVEVIGKKVAVAWKATAEAARALTAASFILSRAEKVVILSVSEDEAGDDSDRVSAEHLARQLAWQGIAAEVRMSYSPSVATSQALLDMAYDSDADLLVMGAYGHNRMQELIFGGVTRDLLAGSALPIFMVR